VIGLIAASAIGVALVLGLAFVLPCEGCRLRRMRMRRAYDHWRASKSK
jgi:hypothetical protein